jgi:CHRD domain
MTASTRNGALLAASLTTLTLAVLPAVGRSRAAAPHLYRLSAQLRAPGVVVRPTDLTSVQAVWSGILTVDNGSQEFRWRFAPRRPGLVPTAIHLHLGAGSSGRLLVRLCPRPACRVNSDLVQVLHLSPAILRDILRGQTSLDVHTVGGRGPLIGGIRVLSPAIASSG